MDKIRKTGLIIRLIKTSTLFQGNSGIGTHIQAT